MNSFWFVVSDYSHYYYESVREFWMHMRPASYSAVLATVWLIGFLLLKSGARR